MATETNEIHYTPAMLLQQWMGHRRVTRKTIEAFPEDKLFTFSLGGMRTFGALVHEFLGMALPTARMVATGSWGDAVSSKPTEKAGVLALWDEHTAEIDALLPTIRVERYATKIKMYEQYEVTGLEAIEYTIDNEIHHRGQGFVYLRALGLEPPMFYDRA